MKCNLTQICPPAPRKMVACPHRCVEFVTPAPRMRGFVLIAYGLAHRYHRIIPPQLSGPRTGVGAVGNLPRGFVRCGLSAGPRPPCGGRFFVVACVPAGQAPRLLRRGPACAGRKRLHIRTLGAMAGRNGCVFASMRDAGHPYGVMVASVRGICHPCPADAGLRVNSLWACP